MPKSKTSKSLTDLRCRSLETGRHGDGQGLYLEVKAGGTRSWALIYQLDGKRRQMGLGPFPDVSLADARERASKMRAMVKRDKVDPLALQGKRAASNKKFREYAEEYINIRKASWSSDKSSASWKGTLSKYVDGEIGDKSVSSISVDDVYKLLTKDNFWGQRHETASRTRQRIVKIMDYAKAQGAKIISNPADMAGNLEARLPNVRAGKPVEHLRSLNYKHAPGFLAELINRDEISAKAMIWVLLTACRLANVRLMSWKQLQFDEGIWVCPKEEMKAKVEHKVPISEDMIAWIKGMPRVGDFVFATGDGKKPMSDHTLLSLLRRMGYTKDDMTVHGLRSTFSTWANEKTNYQNNIIEAALSHQIGNRVSQAYNRSDLLDKRRKLMVEWQEYLGFK